jgi:hypothetical protein
MRKTTTWKTPDSMSKPPMAYATVSTHSRSTPIR